MSTRPVCTGCTTQVEFGEHNDRPGILIFENSTRKEFRARAIVEKPNQHLSTRQCVPITYHVSRDNASAFADTAHQSARRASTKKSESLKNY